MKRSDIFERLYELNDSDKKDSVTKVMYDLINNKITNEEAEMQLRLIDPYYARYEFLQNLKGKPIYKNIIEFKKGNLSDIQIIKMVSSLITQILIQKEQNADLDINSLQVDVLLDMIKRYSVGNEIDFDRLNDLLDQYGWSDQ